MCYASQSSSLDTSETSATPPSTTASQRSMHARDFDEWRLIGSKLRYALDPTLHKRGERVSACCCSPVFCLTSNAALKVAPGFCRDRLCPSCARRRSRQTFHRLTAAVGSMDSPRFITLTQKAKNEPLFLSLARLRGNFRTLRKSPLWSRNVTGGVYSIEVTRNPETKLFHVHLHIVADGQFIAQSRLAEAWKQATGDSFIVDIRAIHSRTEVSAYITKYIAKPANITHWPQHAFEEYARDMSGVRMVHSFGNQHDRPTEPGDDGCIIQRAEPLVSTKTVLRRLYHGCPLAADVVHLMNRHGGTFRRCLGLAQPPEDDPPLPLTQPEMEELIDKLRRLSRWQDVLEIPKAVHRMADFRLDECPWR
jgi:Replication protein